MLIDGKRDSLQDTHIDFYYNHLDHHKKIDLNEGIYFLIFDISVNSDSVFLTLRRKNQPPVLFQRNNGYFMIVCQEKSFVEFDMDYVNQQDPMQQFAKLFAVTEPVLGTTLPEDLKFTDIYGKEFNKCDFKGKISIFIDSPSRLLLPEVKKLVDQFPEEISVIVRDTKSPKKLDQFSKANNYSNFIFSSVYQGYLRLGAWSKSIHGWNELIWLCDKDTQLQYRHRFSYDYLRKNDYPLAEELKSVIKRIKDRNG